MQENDGIYRDELKVLEKYVHSLEIAEESVLHYRQAVDLLQDKFLDAYLIKVMIRFGEEQQGIVIFVLSKMRKKILCIKGAFVNDSEAHILNRFYPESNYSSYELDKEFVDIESYNTYSIEYSNQLAIDIYRSFDSHLITRIILNLEKEGTVDNIQKKIYEICKTKKKDDIELQIKVGFQDISSVKYRSNSELEKGHKKIASLLENLEEAEEQQEEKNKNPKVKIQRKPEDELGNKFNEFYKEGYKNFFFIQTIVEPINGLTVEQITQEHNVFVNFIDDNFKKLLGETSDNKNLPFPYKELFECKSDKKNYLFMSYKNSILYSIEEDKSVKLKVQRIDETDNLDQNLTTNKQKKYLDSELFKVGLMVIILFVLLIYLFFK